MISELNNEEILDFLMNSDFEGDFKPEELKYLLVKWRYFFRLSQGKLETLRKEYEGLADKSDKDLKVLESEINNILTSNAKLKDSIDFIKSRKLTLKERITGKIIYKENEN
jgi:hypothetical protein